VTGNVERFSSRGLRIGIGLGVLAMFATPALWPSPASSAGPATQCFGQTPTVVGTGADETFSDSGNGTPITSGDVVFAAGGRDRVVVEGRISDLRICLGRGADGFTSLGSKGKQPFLISGDEGYDHLIAKAGAGSAGRPMRLLGGTGGDVLEGAGVNDIIDGGAGWDHILGGSGNDLLRAGGGRDRVEGGDGADRLRGEGGDDQLSGGFLHRKDIGLDYVDGGPGHDQCRGEKRLRCEAPAP
jgi:Ca2+-binding RTX toxin-like protein